MEHSQGDQSSNYKKNSLTLWGAVSMGTGVMIGAGIFALTGQVAENVVRQASANIPAEVTERFDAKEKLSDDDREVIIQIAQDALIEIENKATQD